MDRYLAPGLPGKLIVGEAGGDQPKEGGDSNKKRRGGATSERLQLLKGRIGEENNEEKDKRSKTRWCQTLF